MEGKHESKKDNVGAQDLGEESKPLLHDFKAVEGTKMFTSKVIVIFVIAAILGVGSGYALAHQGGGSTSGPSAGSNSSSTGGKVEGSNDLSTFKDTAEGTLQVGGIEGEGQFHLVRPGGDSQNVYLISSIVDLSKFVGKKVKVWGQTQAAQKAGWLMDVGRVEIL